jgi:uncharacterized protein
MKSRVLLLIAGLLLVAAPVAAAPSKDCGKARTCNPQAECLKQAERALKDGALDAARRDCSRMPTKGTCYAQSADCQDSKKAEEPRRKR